MNRQDAKSAKNPLALLTTWRLAFWSQAVRLLRGLSLVADRHHRYILAVGANDGHRPFDGIVVLPFRNHLVFGELAVGAGVVRSHRQSFLFFVIRSFRQHRRGGHGVDPDADVLLL